MPDTTPYQYQNPQPNDPNQPFITDSEGKQSLSTSYLNWIHNLGKSKNLGWLAVVNPGLAASAFAVNRIENYLFKPTSYTYQSGDDVNTLAQKHNTTPEEIIAANPGGFPFSTGQSIKLPAQPPAVGTPTNYNPYGAPTTYSNYKPPETPFTLNSPPVAQSDFMNTKFMQEYAANGTPLERQLRWDPEHKKYISVGKWLRQEQRQRTEKRRARMEAQGVQDNLPHNTDASSHFINFSLSAG